jgi:hypothetical protein
VAEDIEVSTVRKDVEAALRKELGRSRSISFTLKPGSAPRAVVTAKCNLLEEYIALLTDDNMNVILKVEREFPENGRIRL